MKAYAIFPLPDMQANGPRRDTCIKVVTAMVVQALRRGGNHFHFVVDWRDPGTRPGSAFHEKLAEPHITRLADVETLTAQVRRSVDPADGFGSTIRSIATCRAATFGYDGQAFLCLRHEDRAPVTWDQSLVRVEERASYLTETDYFDGWVHVTSGSS